LTLACQNNIIRQDFERQKYAKIVNIASKDLSLSCLDYFHPTKILSDCKADVFLTKSHIIIAGNDNIAYKYRNIYIGRIFDQRWMA
jgi:hypothetical protein